MCFSKVYSSECGAPCRLFVLVGIFIFLSQWHGPHKVFSRKKYFSTFACKSFVLFVFSYMALNKVLRELGTNKN